MYTFRALECVVNKNQESLPVNNAASAIEAANLASLTLQDISERIDALLVACTLFDEKIVTEFAYYRDEILSLITLTSHDGSPLFDGHIDVDIDLSNNSAHTVRVYIPDLVGRFNQFHTNYKSVAANTVETFAERMRETDTAVNRAEATVQGVRLNTFTSKPCRHNRLPGINSLNGLTGLHCMSYGNAMVAPMPCRDTEMPLTQGGILINGHELSACDGSIDSLVASINNTTDKHGVVAVGQAGQNLVLIDEDGGRIEVDVLHQAGSILSGFPCGSSRVDASTNGLLVWLSFRHLAGLTFDSCQTAKLMSGDKALEVPLRSGMLKSLSLDSPYHQKLTIFVLQVVKKSIKQEYNNITNSLTQFKILSRSQKTSSPMGRN